MSKNCETFIADINQLLFVLPSLADVATNAEDIDSFFVSLSQLRF
jgi:hypothetical protein